MSHPREDETSLPHPALVRPYVPKPSREGRVVARVPAHRPVRIRVVGLPADVDTFVDFLSQACVVTDRTEPRPAPDHEVMVYATVFRRFPFSGGIK